MCYPILILMKARWWPIIRKALHLPFPETENAPFPVRYRSAWEFRKWLIITKRLALDLFLILLGVFSAGFGLKGFLLPNKFIDGGAVGISLLLAELDLWPLSKILLVVNIPFILLAVRTVHKEFAWKTCLGIILLALAVAFIPYPEITQDRLLIAVFGGFFIGLGVGLAIRGGGVLDGTEVLAIYLSKRFGFTMGDIILMMNIAIFSVAVYLLSVEIALYSLLTYLAASKTVDFVIEGIDEYMSVTIISPKAEQLRLMITEKLGRGVTVFKGERGYGRTLLQNSEIRIIYTVVTRWEVSRLKLEIESISPDAFVIVNSVKDTKGGMLKRRTI